MNIYRRKNEKFYSRTKIRSCNAVSQEKSNQDLINAWYYLKCVKENGLHEQGDDRKLFGGLKDLTA